MGNVCNAAPSADNACPLLVYDGEAVIVHPGGERTLPLVEFFRGPGLTALELGEMVKEIRVPVPGPRSGSNYQKISARSKVDIAAVCVAVCLDLDEEGVISRIRVALGAVAPVPIRARGTEKLLLGKTLTPELLAEAGAKASEEASPITDVRATAAYRRKMIDVLAVRALEKSHDIASQRRAGCEL